MREAQGKYHHQPPLLLAQRVVLAGKLVTIAAGNARILTFKSIQGT
jgi:hypothetical protein